MIALQFVLLMAIAFVMFALLSLASDFDRREMGMAEMFLFVLFGLLAGILVCSLGLLESVTAATAAAGALSAVPFRLEVPPLASVLGKVIKRTQSVEFYHGACRCECLIEFCRPDLPDGCGDTYRRGFGYIRIPAQVPVDMALVEALNDAAHWGITYPTLASCSEEELKEIDTGRVVGFDCQHLYDGTYHKTEEYIVECLIEMADILNAALAAERRGIGRCP